MKAPKDILGIKQSKNGRNFWTKIGVAFQNSGDGSWNLFFDYIPVRGETTIQLRDPRAGEEQTDEPGSPVVSA
jgi:hypothetical protein